MKQLLIILLSVMPVSWTSQSELHKFYVSVTKVEYVKKEKSLQIINQIFIDDFENVLRKRFDENITLAEPNESERIESYMKQYLKDKIKIEVNGKPVNFVYLGKEYEDDMVYSYLEIEGVDQIRSFSIANKVLFELFEEQENIIRTSINGKDKSFILVTSNHTGVLNFD